VKLINKDYPKISIITPSYNQGDFLEKTIISVLSQNYPNLEYIIIDGGSTDGSVDIIKKYQNKLFYWESVIDKGQSHAINKGFALSTGEWIAWQNSDDIYMPNSLFEIADIINRTSRHVNLLIANIYLIDENDLILSDLNYVKPTYMSILHEGMVLANQAAFWRREIFNTVGMINENLHYNFDYEWFIRILRNKNKARHLNKYVGALRMHNNTKTAKRPEMFAIEKALIIEGRFYIKYLKFFYILRRAFLLIAMGNYKYVLRGINKQIKKYVIK
jgi:glycosyltransferase involved in cell wall biosynthesis